MRRASATLASTPCWVNWPPLGARDSSSASIPAVCRWSLRRLKNCRRCKVCVCSRANNGCAINIGKDFGFSIDSNVNGVSTDLRSRFLDGSNQAVEPYCRTTSDDPSSRILKDGAARRSRDAINNVALLRLQSPPPRLAAFPKSLNQPLPTDAMPESPSA